MTNYYLVTCQLRLFKNTAISSSNPMPPATSITSINSGSAALSQQCTTLPIICHQASNSSPKFKAHKNTSSAGCQGNIVNSVRLQPIPELDGQEHKRSRCHPHLSSEPKGTYPKCCAPITRLNSCIYDGRWSQRKSRKPTGSRTLRNDRTPPLPSGRTTGVYESQWAKCEDT